MSVALHFKHVCLDPHADDSPTKAKVQHVDTSLSNDKKTDCKNKDGKMPDPIQGKRKLIILFFFNFHQCMNYLLCMCLFIASIVMFCYRR